MRLQVSFGARQGGKALAQAFKFDSEGRVFPSSTYLFRRDRTSDKSDLGLSLRLDRDKNMSNLRSDV